MWQSLLGPGEIIVIFLEAAALETLSGLCSVQERKKSQHILAAYRIVHVMEDASDWVLNNVYMYEHMYTLSQKNG